jgi:hypothetical protein
MNLSDIVGYFRHAEATPNQVIELPDPEAGGGVADDDARSGEYFQIRLSEMYLTDKRRWHQEVAPAGFIFTDFQYDGKQVRRPFFVSNSLLPELPLGDDAKALRVRFSNISVLGPVPYGGGDVDLFVGLFQTALVDWRKSLFQVFEKIFGAIGPNPVSPWMEKIDSLSDDLLACLGLKDVTCLLAEHLGIGMHAIPRAGYLAYLRYSDPPVPKEQLQVHEGRLHRMVDGALRQFDETDYCLVRVQRLATRNDYAALPFHKLWEQARIKVLRCNQAEAQALFLDCAEQILSSPELTEGDKTHLIRYYQSALHDMQAPPALEAAQGATRAGAEEIIGTMRNNAVAANDFDSDEIKRAYEDLMGTATEFTQRGGAEHMDQQGIASYLEQARRQPAPAVSPATLVRALALGSIVRPAARAPDAY